MPSFKFDMKTTEAATSAAKFSRPSVPGSSASGCQEDVRQEARSLGRRVAKGEGGEGLVQKKKGKGLNYAIFKFDIQYILSCSKTRATQLRLIFAKPLAERAARSICHITRSREVVEACFDAVTTPSPTMLANYPYNRLENVKDSSFTREYRVQNVLGNIVRRWEGDAEREGGGSGDRGDGDHSGRWGMPDVAFHRSSRG
ncbi:hypothetical protein B0H12DRAFT_1080883 [Mycena haematopus]|nr:hypothetical protein B0H12DRAFT_1080883 [Mycena haematopus]